MNNLPVEEDPGERPLKVLSKTSKSLLKNIRKRGALFAMGPLVSEVIINNLVDGVRMRDGNELVVLGDVLPVVYENGLDVVGDREFDRGP